VADIKLQIPLFSIFSPFDAAKPSAWPESATSVGIGNVARENLPKAAEPSRYQECFRRTTR